MKSRKVLMGYILAMVCSILLIVSCFCLPMAKVIVNNSAGSPGAIPELSGNFKMFEFLNINVCEIMYQVSGGRWTSGPFWLVTAGIGFNIIMLIGCIFAIVLGIIGLVCYFKNVNFFQKNGAFKHIGLITAVIGLIVSFAGIFGFLGLNASAQGYMEAYALAGFYVNAVLCIALIVGSCLAGNKEVTNNNIVKKCIIFGLIFVFSVVISAFLEVGIVQINGDFEKYFSVFNKEYLNDLAYGGIRDLSGPVSTGLIITACFLKVDVAFLGIYAFIAFILTLCKKNTNWLNGRVKAWSKIGVIDAILFVVFVLSANVIYFGQINIPEGEIYTSWTVWATLVIAFVGFIISFLLPYVKPLKKVKSKKVENNMQEAEV